MVSGQVTGQHRALELFAFASGCTWELLMWGHFVTFLAWGIPLHRWIDLILKLSVSPVGRKIQVGMFRYTREALSLFIPDKFLAHTFPSACIVLLGVPDFFKDFVSNLGKSKPFSPFLNILTWQSFDQQSLTLVVFRSFLFVPCMFPLRSCKLRSSFGGVLVMFSLTLVMYEIGSYRDIYFNLFLGMKGSSIIFD